jgi:hypothetical protein
MMEPDADAIKAHLIALFAPCVEHYPSGLIELRYGSPAPTTSAYFAANSAGMDEAAQFAATRNREGANVYVGVNPRKPATKGAASDTDVACAFWHFADLDDAEAVDMAGQRLKALPPTMTVTTGLEPHRRPHFYWLLEEPVGNMQAWTERQRAIADNEGIDAHGTARYQEAERKNYKFKTWVTSQNERVCPICTGNEAQGLIPIQQAFQNRSMYQPAHPNCRCAVNYVADNPRAIALEEKSNLRRQENARKAKEEAARNDARAKR